MRKSLLMSSVILKLLLMSALAVFELNAQTNDSNLSNFTVAENNHPLINKNGMNIKSRFLPPEGFSRIKTNDTSFAFYLQNLPLKKDGSLVKYYTGETKPNHKVYDAVVDLPIGTQDLHQCADALMRLRAEYLWKQKKYNQIHFNFTNNFRVDYSMWRKGNRIVLGKNNKTYWVKSQKPSTSYADFWAYLEQVFMYAGTLSLSKELKPIPVSKMEIGAVFIKGGSPGHCVMVVDMAINPKTKKKVFLLAQSYMPAQEIQILQNNTNPALSPWYEVDFGETLETPEWKTNADQLKKFE